MTKTTLAKEIATTLRKKRMTDTTKADKLSPGEAATALAKALQALPDKPKAELPATADADAKPTAAAPAAAPAADAKPPAAPTPAPAAPAAPAASPSMMPAPTEAPVTLHHWLKDILSRRRCHNSEGDMAFRKWIMDVARGMGHKAEVMEGNIVFTVKGKNKKESPTLFSSHVDTCHSEAESNGQRQLLAYDKNMEHLFLARLDHNDNSVTTMPRCMGADDGAGVYIMLRMMEAKVPGTYVFHIGEEKGCIGSRQMANKQSAWLGKFTHAIAFDRQGDEDIIVTQGGQACASPECGEALGKAINATHAGLNMKVSHKGVLTDVKHYAYDIPECINLAVGYEHQHSSDESLDVAHLERLVNACVKIDWAALPVKRKCAERFQGNYGGYESDRSGRDYGYGSGFERARLPDSPTGRQVGNASLSSVGSSGRSVGGYGNRDLFESKTATKAVASDDLSPADWLLSSSRDDISAWFDEQPDEAVRGVYALIARVRSLERQVEVLEELL